MSETKTKTRGRVIFFASPKGGVGKSTTAINLACIFARMLKEAKQDGTVTLIDGDKNGFGAFFAIDHADQVPENMRIVYAGDDKERVKAVEASCVSSAITLVDFEGAAGKGLLDTLQYADLIITPLKPVVADARIALVIVEMIKDLKKQGLTTVEHRILYNMVKPPIETKVAREIKSAMADAGIKAFHTEIHDLSAIRAITDHKHRIDNPPANKSNDKSTVNALRMMYALAAEVLAIMEIGDINTSERRELEDITGIVPEMSVDRDLEDEIENTTGSASESDEDQDSAQVSL